MFQRKGDIIGMNKHLQLSSTDSILIQFVKYSKSNENEVDFKMQKVLNKLSVGI